MSDDSYDPGFEAVDPRAREQAFERLGLSTDATRDEIRRAYLRQLRHHKPEVDPEGFKALREAFELASTPSATVTAGTAVADETDRDSTDREPDPDVEEWHRVRQLLAETQPEERADCVRAAIAAHPTNGHLRALLITVYMQQGDDDAAVETLRNSLDAGFQGLLDDFIRRFPLALPEDEIERWAQQAPIAWVLDAARESLLGESVDRCSQLLGLARRRWENDMGPTGSTVMPASEPLSWSLFVLFVLAHALPAPDLAAVVSDWLETTIVDEPADLRDEIAPLWTVALEIAALPGRFPLALRRAIAEALLNGQLTAAGDAMHDFAMRQPGEAEHAADLLEATPVLHHFYHHLLSGPRSTSYAGPPPIVIPVTGILLLLFVLFGSGDREEKRLSESMSQLATGLVEAQTPPGEPPRVTHLFKACRARPDDTDACVLANAVRWRLASTHCARALESLNELDAVVSSAAVSAAETHHGAETDDSAHAVQADTDPLAFRRTLADWALDAWNETCLHQVWIDVSDRVAGKLSHVTELCNAAAADVMTLNVCSAARQSIESLRRTRCDDARVFFDQMNALVQDEASLSYRAVEDVFQLIEELCAQ